MMRTIYFDIAIHLKETSLFSLPLVNQVDTYPCEMQIPLLSQNTQLVWVFCAFVRKILGYHQRCHILESSDVLDKISK